MTDNEDDDAEEVNDDEDMTSPAFVVSQFLEYETMVDRLDGKEVSTRLHFRANDEDGVVLQPQACNFPATPS